MFSESSESTTLPITATSMRTWLPMLVVTLAFGCAARQAGPSAEERVAALEETVIGQRATSDAALASYMPDAAKTLDDLGDSAVEILRGLPGVAKVELLVAAEKPTHRIIHLRDWHWVPRDLFAADLGLTLDAAESRYREHLAEVELVQIEQLTFLRCLIRHHGLKQVLAEGLTASGVENYDGVVAAYRATEHRLKNLEAEFASLKNKPDAMAREIERFKRDLRRSLLEFGVAGQLAIGEEIAVGPLDDEAALEAAKPVRPDGAVKHDADKVRAREDAIVAAALKSGKLSLLILGGAHNLSDSVRRLGAGRAEYIRVTTNHYEEVAGKK